MDESQDNRNVASGIWTDTAPSNVRAHWGNANQGAEEAVWVTSSILGRLLGIMDMTRHNEA
jgi:hypothetical protein